MDRRSDRRYGIALDLRWKLMRGKQVLDSGTGTTVDLSRRGLLFETDRELRAGVNIELSIAWPALLRNVIPLQLRMIAEVVRVGDGRVAVRILHHEFRTVSLTVTGRAASS